MFRDGPRRHARKERAGVCSDLTVPASMTAGTDERLSEENLHDRHAGLADKLLGFRRRRAW